MSSQNSCKPAGLGHLGLSVVYSQSISSNLFKPGHVFLLKMNHREDFTCTKWSAVVCNNKLCVNCSSFTGSSNMVTGETKSFFSFAKSVSVSVIMLFPQTSISSVALSSSSFSFLSIELLLLMLCFCAMFSSGSTARPELDLCAFHIAIEVVCETQISYTAKLRLHYLFT